MVLEYWNNCKIEHINLDNRGRIGHNANIAFMFGHCHSLAVALHDLAGFPLYSFVVKELDDTRYSPGHIAVKINSKDYLDIEGPGALIRWKEIHPSTRAYKIHRDIIVRGLDCYLPVQIEKAVPFAKTLLKEYNLT